MAIINHISSTIAGVVTGQSPVMNQPTYAVDSMAKVSLAADVLFSEGQLLWPERSVPEFTGPMGECSTRTLRRLPDHRCPASTVERSTGSAVRRVRGTATLEQKLNPNHDRSGYLPRASRLERQPSLQVDSKDRPQVAIAETTTAKS
jgi:hypothetical protein